MQRKFSWARGSRGGLSQATPIRSASAGHSSAQIRRDPRALSRGNGRSSAPKTGPLLGLQAAAGPKTAPKPTRPRKLPRTGAVPGLAGRSAPGTVQKNAANFADPSGGWERGQSGVSNVEPKGVWVTSALVSRPRVPSRQLLWSHGMMQFRDLGDAVEKRPAEDSSTELLRIGALTGRVDAGSDQRRA
jgi:hypothetical protein